MSVVKTTLWLASRAGSALAAIRERRDAVGRLRRRKAGNDLARVVAAGYPLEREGRRFAARSERIGRYFCRVKTNVPQSGRGSECRNSQAAAVDKPDLHLRSLLDHGPDDIGGQRSARARQESDLHVRRVLRFASARGTDSGPASHRRSGASLWRNGDTEAVGRRGVGDHLPGVTAPFTLLHHYRAMRGTWCRIEAEEPPVVGRCEGGQGNQDCGENSEGDHHAALAKTHRWYGACLRLAGAQKHIAP